MALVTALLLTISSVALAAGFLVKEGSRGEDVRTVQTLLQERGYYQGEITGICEQDTVEAIKDFQRANNLEVDGICGYQTYNRLNPPKVTHDYAQAVPMTVTAYAYSPQDPGLSSHTSSGTPLRRGVIAVDPSVIPMGTCVYIPGYGEAVAEDIGWSIQGHTIDIAFDTHDEALSWGRQTIEIFVLY